MDTDGFVYTSEASDNSSVSVEYCSSSVKLAESVEFLVRSLGGTASTKSSGSARRAADGTRHPGRTRYRVRVSLPEGINPFSLSRKAERYQRSIQPSRRIIGVDYVGKKPAQCILLNSENHLYITDDFVVTHNTMLASQFLANMADRDINCLFFSLEQGAGSFFRVCMPGFGCVTNGR